MTRGGQRTADSAASHARLIALAGVATYMVYAFLLTNDYYGVSIYDVYFERILGGRLDLPLRVITYEGHYLPDGTVYTYHGVAPLITRFLFGFFLPTDGSVLPFLSIFMWSVIGAAAWHWCLVGQRLRARGKAPGYDPVVPLIAAGVWFTGPALLLVPNASLYIEPIVVAFAATALFFAVLWAQAEGKLARGRAYVIAAAFAAIAIHARPHVGLCLGLGLGVWMLLRWRSADIPTMLVAALIGFGSIGGLLALNYAKFGDPLVMHGTFDTSDELVHGIAKLELRESSAARSIDGNGRFSPDRIARTAAPYALDLPPINSSRYVRTLSANESDPVRYEWPHIGILPLWLAFFVLLALFWRRKGDLRAETIALLVSAGALAVFVLSYPTITHRYKVELWPLFGAILLVGLGGFERDVKPAKLVVALAMLLAAIPLNLYVAAKYSVWHADHDDFRVWTEPYCIKRLDSIFPPERIVELCRDD